MKFDVQKYFETSTIHGLGYVSKKFHFIERIFWIISLIFSVICTSILIVELVIKIRNFPIVVYLSDQPIPVSEINFPAITVCPRLFAFVSGMRRVVRNNYYYNFRYERHTLQRFYYEEEESAVEFKDEMKYGNISYLSFLDKIENGTIKPKDLGIKILKRLQVIDLISRRDIFYKQKFSIPTEDFLDVANEFKKEFEDSLAAAFFWFDRYEQYVAEIITPWGLCFTFNSAFSRDSLHLNSTSEDFHYSYNPRALMKINKLQTLEDYPKKTSTSNSGLWVSFSDHETIFINDVIKNNFDGYICLLHSPYELPSLNSKIVKFNRKLQTDILIDPQLNTIDYSLYEDEPAERNCYLENEKILKFFKVYTKNNCENECLTDFMISRCGCVEFFMIRNSSTRICSANEKNCYEKAQENFEEKKKYCECFEPCEHIKYDFDIIEYGLTERNSRNPVFRIGFGLQYKKNVFNQFIRKKQFNELDFLSFVGGILGLFAGFSTLSFVELIYWFTIRAFIKDDKKIDTRVYPINKDLQVESKNEKIKSFFMSYFNESSIHGLTYILQPSRIGNFFWISFIMSALTICLHLILGAHQKVPDSRVIAFDDNLKMIKNIPFPAITIIPEYSLPIEFAIGNFYFKVLKYSWGKEDLENEKTREAFKKNLTKYHFCDEMYDQYSAGYNFSFIPYLLNALKEDSKIGWFLDQFSLFNEKYQPEFAEIRTSRGMGFSFNIIDADEMFNFDQIDPIFRYFKNITTKSENLVKFPNSTTYPLKFNREDKVSFLFKLQKPLKRSWYCIKQSLFVHHADYLPTFSPRKDFATFDYGTSVDVTVTPEIIRTDEGLKNLRPSERECYFDGEKPLKFFKKYSQKNCEVECFTNITLEVCSCVSIIQPFMSEDSICLNHTRVDPNFCMNILEHRLYEYEDFSSERNCSCLPTCNSISYNIKYYTKYDTEGNETTINVRMNMDDIILFRRYQQFTFSDVVSYVGGLLGLFAGISMLSIVEFFYFFTIRLGVNLWRFLMLRRQQNY